MIPTERKVHNIAMDLAINGHLPNLPEMACIPGKGPFAHLNSGKSTEHYLRELRKMQKDPPPEEGEGGEGEGGTNGGTPGTGEGQGQSGGNPLDGLDSLDDHSGWDEVDEQAKQIAEERVKEFIKDAVKKRILQAVDGVAFQPIRARRLWKAFQLRLIGVRFFVTL